MPTLPSTRPDWQSIDTPALLVDLDRLESNIAAMAARTAAAGVALRPHFKTHKSVSIAHRQIAAGAIGLTVSKLDEAAVLLNAGIDNVLVATQIVGSGKAARAAKLAGSGRLIVGVDSESGARSLSVAAGEAGVTLELSMEIDCGLGRCGVLPSDAVVLAKAIGALPHVTITGVFTHGGQAYGASDMKGVRSAAADERGAVVTAAGLLNGAGIECEMVSIGSTPTVIAQVEYDGATEVRPGNYVFFDAIQVALGVATADDCALTVAATVTSRPAADRIVLDTGSKSLGLDKGAHGTGVISNYGTIVGYDGSLDRLSEEHGIAAVPVDSPLQVGDRVRILPNHACSVANLHDRYHGHRNGIVETEILIDAVRGVH